MAGVNYLRYIVALASTRSYEDAAAFAEARYGPLSIPARITKAVVQAGSTIPSDDWGDALSPTRQAADEFFASATAGSIIARMTGIRKVPPNVRVIGLTEGATASFVRQGRPKPVSRASLEATSLSPLKVASLAIVTQELLRHSAAEALLAQDLGRALTEAMDSAFADPGNPGVTDEMPASVFNNAPSTPATGNIDEDLRDFVADFEGNLETAYFIASPATLAFFSSASHPNISIRGVGELMGIPAIASRGMPTGNLGLLDASAVALVEGPLIASRSSQGTVNMVDDPAEPDATTTVISLWQSNMVGILLERFVNWTLARSGASLMTGVTGGT